jgi:hypothetical protein
MFDVTTEQPISLAQAATLVPPARRGRRTHLSTILRWILRGAKAPDGAHVKLEAVRLGGRWMTSKAALQRFAERLTPSLDGNGVPSAPRAPAKRQQASDRAAAELERLGV